MTAIKELQKKFNGVESHLDLDKDIGSEELQMVIKENNRQPGEFILVKNTGKVGFLTKNSIPVRLGDVVKGIITREEENFFLFEAHELVSGIDD